MKDNPQELDLQLNTPAPEADSYSLEDIMKEFGGWTPPEPEPVPEPAPEPPAEAPDLMRVAAPDTVGKADKPKFKLIDLSGDTVRFTPVTEEEAQAAAEPEPKAEPAEMPEEPEAPTPDKAREREQRRAQQREAKRLRRLASQRKKALKAQLRAQKREEPERVYPSPEDACAAYAKGGSQRLRMLGTGAMTAASMILLVLSQFPLGKLDFTGQKPMFSVIMLALLLAQSVLSLDVFLRGVYQALRMRFDLLSLLVLTVLLTVVDSFFAIPSGRIPFCATASLALLVALRSIGLEKKAKWRTLKTVLSMDAPVAAVKEEKAWRGLDCIFRREGSLEDFTAMLETPDAAQKVMRIYAPVAAALTAALALFAGWYGNGSFLWSWAALTTAALPIGGFLACVRPFSILAARLSKVGAAICGWRGAKVLSGEGGIAIEDNDLFPAASISMNGMKMYSDLPVRQVVGYATAVVQAAGSGLLPLFEEVMINENARRYTVDTFRQYEGGGLGAEIHGDVVLLGSLSFMNIMGVPTPGSTHGHPAAYVYISVNKELAGVFALTYSPAAGTRSGLHHVLHSPGLTPILATRDFMITPGMVKKHYKIPADRLEFPIVADRARLSGETAGQNGRQGALMSRNNFLSFASAVTGGRQLRRTVHSAVLVSLMAGVLGMVLLCLLTYLDAVAAASAFNLLLYQLLWQIPLALITSFVGKT